MKNNTILTYDDVKSIKGGNSNEALVDVRKYDTSIVPQYEKFDMVAYTGFEILVRETVAKKLALVNQQLKEKYGLTLKVAYGYRALEVQTSYFSKKLSELKSVNSDLSLGSLTALTHNFIAVPEVAGHVTGGAIDLTLVNSNGIACDMGTKIADFSDPERIKTFGAGLTAKQKRLRRILLDAMMVEGFAPFLGEWWHFCYGDKEWAAYYGKSCALYDSVVMRKTAKILKIAGGNETVLQVTKGKQTMNENEQAGKALLNVYSTAEQSGLVYVDDKRLEMAGGEFCGNASAAAAVLLSNKLSVFKVQYSVSGFEGSVVAEVMSADRNDYRVRTSFNGMDYKVENFEYKGKQLKVVDMEGIVHILIENIFPASKYEPILYDLVDVLNLYSREAVGVIWYEQRSERVKVNPVVWVKKVDTLYYESACGSGSIAATLATGKSTIVQPTGECINVYIDQNKITTECEVMIVDEVRTK